MDLIRCQDQQQKSLEEFYASLGEHESGSWRACAEAMLDLIQRLRDLAGEHRVYTLTSHARLCLLATDAYDSPWFVIITVLDRMNYFVEYLMPKDAAPWPHAYVRGEARSEEQAVRMVAIAMAQSRGWIL